MIGGLLPGLQEHKHSFPIKRTSTVHCESMKVNIGLSTTGWLALLDPHPWPNTPPKVTAAMFICNVTSTSMIAQIVRRFQC